MPVAGCLGVRDAGKQSCAEQVGDSVRVGVGHAQFSKFGFTQKFPKSTCDWLVEWSRKIKHVHSTYSAVIPNIYLLYPTAI